MKRDQKPNNELTLLGFPTDIDKETLTKEKVNFAYRKLSLLHHPDKGGKQETFILITEAKHKLLTWLN